MKNISIIEDDENIRELVLYALNSSGFYSVGFENGSDFFDNISTEEIIPDLILLDIMLPGDDGLSILKKLKNSENKSIPVIMVTAKGSEMDRIKGLDMGADDYVSKPFSVLELISRVNAVLRRTQNFVDDSSLLVYENIQLDTARRAVMVEDENVVLTYKEYELLHYFLMNIGIVLSRDKIIQQVWGFDFKGESRTIDMHIKTLRQKLGSAGTHIKTVRNVGYKIGE